LNLGPTAAHTRRTVSPFYVVREIFGPQMTRRFPPPLDIIHPARDNDVLPAFGLRQLLIRTGVIERREYGIDFPTLGRVWIDVGQMIRQHKVFGTKFFLQFGHLPG
jgi:hypothetical protein